MNGTNAEGKQDFVDDKTDDKLIAMQMEINFLKLCVEKINIKQEQQQHSIQHLQNLLLQLRDKG